MKQYKKQLTVRTSEEVIEMLQAEAERLQVSQNLIAHMILSKVAEEYGKKVQTQQ